MGYLYSINPSSETVPLYDFLHLGYGHIYTTNRTIAAYHEAAFPGSEYGYEFNGIAGYIYPKGDQPPGTVPLYRYTLIPSMFNHQYVTNTSHAKDLSNLELDHDLTYDDWFKGYNNGSITSGFVKEGIIGFLLSSNSSKSNIPFEKYYAQFDQSGNIDLSRNPEFGRNLYTSDRSEVIFDTKSNPINLGKTIGISNNNGWSVSADIAVDKKNVFVVWIDSVTGKNNIFFVKSSDDGLTFSSPLNLTTNGGITSNPKIYADDSKVYIVWSERLQGKSEIFFIKSIDGGKTFSKKINISNSETFDSVNPRVISSQNNVFIVWHEYSGGKSHIVYRYSGNHGINFGTNTIVSEGPLPGSKGFIQGIDIAGYKDRLFIAYTIDNERVMCSIIERDKIVNKLQLFNIRSSGTGGTGYIVDSPKLSFDFNEDKLHVVYTVNTDNLEIYYSSIAKTLSSNPFTEFTKAITNSYADSSYPQIVSIGKSGQNFGTSIFVAWTEGFSRDSPGETLYSVSTDGGRTFSTSKSFDFDTVLFNPRLTVLGKILYVTSVTNSPQTGSTDIVIAKSHNGGKSFSESKYISTSFDVSFNPKIMSSESGYIYILWEERTPSNSEIFIRNTNTNTWNMNNYDGKIIGTPDIQISNDTLFIFGKTKNNTISTLSRNLFDNDETQLNNINWIDIGGNLTGNPIGTIFNNSKLYVFAKGYQNNGFHNQSLMSISKNIIDQNWSQWIDLGGNLTSDPFPIVNQDGILQVFAQNTNNNLVSIRQNQEQSDLYDDWINLGGSINSKPVVHIQNNGSINLFTIGMDNNLLQKIRKNLTDSSWSDWISMNGNVTGNPAIGINADGRLIIFAKGMNNDLQYTIQSNNLSSWSEWKTLSKNISSDPKVAINSEGRLVVFAKSGDDIIRWWQVLPSREVWSDYALLSKYHNGNISILVGPDEKINIVLTDLMDRVLHFSEILPSMDK